MRKPFVKSSRWNFVSGVASLAILIPAMAVGSDWILRRGDVEIPLNQRAAMYLGGTPKIGWNSTMDRMPKDYAYDAEQIAFLAKNCRMLRKVTPEFHNTVKRLNPHLVSTDTPSNLT